MSEPKSKSQERREAATKDASENLQTFYYPDLNISVQAVDKAAADKLVEEQINKASEDAAGEDKAE